MCNMKVEASAPIVLFCWSVIIVPNYSLMWIQPQFFSNTILFSNFSQLFLARFFFITLQLVSLKRQKYIMKMYLRWFYQNNSRNYIDFVKKLRKTNGNAEIMAWQSEKVNLIVQDHFSLFSFSLCSVLFFKKREAHLSCPLTYELYSQLFVEFPAGTNTENIE